jgi:hypothetical protein
MTKRSSPESGNRIQIVSEKTPFEYRTVRYSEVYCISSNFFSSYSTFCFQTVQAPKPKCFNCGIQCHLTHSTPKGQMCGTCHQYYQRTGHVRPTTGPARKDGSTKPPPATQKFHSILKNQTRYSWIQKPEI